MSKDETQTRITLRVIDSDKNLKLYPEIPGIIKTIHVKEGQKVLKGTVLIELSND